MVVGWVGQGAPLGVAVLVLAGAVSATAGAQQEASTATSLVFDAVTVVDVEYGKLIRDQRVVITGNRIQMVGDRGKVELPEGARVVAAHGKYLIPGLWDFHSHLWNGGENRDDPYEYGFPLLLANGVTGIREAYLKSEHSMEWHRRLQREVLAGRQAGPPRQLFSIAFNTKFGEDPSETCRNLVVGGNFLDPATSLCDTDLQRLVDSLKAAGYDMLKMYELSASDYFALANAARRAGLRFGGHAAHLAVLDAVDSGASVFDHTNRASAGMLDSLCFNAARSTAESCRPVAEAFRRHNSWSVPTLDMFLSALSPKVYDEFWAGAPFRPGWLNHAASLRLDSLVPDEVKGRFPDAKDRFHCGGITLRIAVQVGLPIAAGADMVQPGFPLHEELWLLTECGLSPLAALQAATLNPAKILGATDSMGTVARGKLADLVLLDADPLADITNTTTIRAVVANGRYFDRTALDNLLVESRAKAPRMP